jgi:hypothetical protein
VISEGKMFVAGQGGEISTIGIRSVRFFLNLPAHHHPFDLATFFSVFFYEEQK